MDSDRNLGDPVHVRVRCTECGAPNVVDGSRRGWRWFLSRARHVCEGCWLKLARTRAVA